MQHPCLGVPAPAQPPFDVEHAAEIAEHHGIGAAGRDVLAFAFGDVRRDVTVLDRKRAAESAALFAFIHLAQFRALDLRQQRARLLFDAEFAQPSAGIMVSY